MKNLRAVPSISDTLMLVDFGEMGVYEDSPLSELLTQELKIFAEDTLWTGEYGPLFYYPGYMGGYPAFTMVRRMAYQSGDTISLDEALNTGYLQERVLYRLGREASMASAESIMDELRITGTNLGSWAQSESLTVFTTPTFSPAQVRQNSQSDPDAISGILSSEEFSLAAAAAPEFQVIGPFSTGSASVIAEILSRQTPPSNPNLTTMMYVATQAGHERLSEYNITEYMREGSEVVDLRLEWEEYAQAVEDSLSAQREAEEQL